jgi:hypothetical protein
LHGKLVPTLWVAIFAGMIVSYAHAQNQSISSGCGANVGTVTNSNVSLNVDCSHRKKAPLSIQYVRLFGGAEVPLLMGLFGRPELSSADPWPATFRALPTKANGDEVLVHVKVIHFFNRYSFKDASPLLTSIWTDVTTNDEAAANILWRASAGLRRERICFFATKMADESPFYIEQLVQKKLIQNENSCRNTITEFDQRIGFTFIVFQNDSDEALTDVHFEYRQNYELDRITSGFTDLPEYLGSGELERIPKAGSPITNLINLYGAAADTELKLNKIRTEDIFAARIEPKQKLIALLNVYIANANGLPATYLSGVYNFDKVSYLIDDAPVVMTVRAPYLIHAARVMVPYGWASQ